MCILHPDYAGADQRAPDFTLKDMNGRDRRALERTAARSSS